MSLYRVLNLSTLKVVVDDVCILVICDNTIDASSSARNIQEIFPNLCILIGIQTFGRNVKSAIWVMCISEYQVIFFIKPVGGINLAHT